MAYCKHMKQTIFSQTLDKIVLAVTPKHRGAGGFYLQEVLYSMARLTFSSEMLVNIMLQHMGSRLTQGFEFWLDHSLTV